MKRQTGNFAVNEGKPARKMRARDDMKRLSACLNPFSCKVFKSGLTLAERLPGAPPGKRLRGRPFFAPLLIARCAFIQRDRGRFAPLFFAPDFIAPGQAPGSGPEAACVALLRHENPEPTGLNQGICHQNAISFFLEPVQHLVARGKSADRDGMQGANRSRVEHPARICNAADRPIPRFCTREQMLNRFLQEPSRECSAFPARMAAVCVAAPAWAQMPARPNENAAHEKCAALKMRRWPMCKSPAPNGPVAA